uniref:Uncharacterized protein n=1 Tax=Romanomermis culicivorax TaxID=13658 RepID=A0A915ITS5_ROMCU
MEQLIGSEWIETEHKKTDYMECGLQTDGTINVSGEDIKRRHNSSTLAPSSAVKDDVRRRMNVAPIMEPNTRPNGDGHANKRTLPISRTNTSKKKKKGLMQKNMTVVSLVNLVILKHSRCQTMEEFFQKMSKPKSRNYLTRIHPTYDKIVNSRRISTFRASTINKSCTLDAVMLKKNSRCHSEKNQDPIMKKFMIPSWEQNQDGRHIKG